MTEDSFDNFKVYKDDDNHFSFIRLDITNKEVFYKGLAQFIIDERNLLNYIQNKKDITFSPSIQNYVSIFKRLITFIDEENEEIKVADDDLEKILAEEFESFRNDKGELTIRLSKIGRIGEYIFHIFLNDYFQFDCIIPKVALTTDKNMSIYGIDELFFCSESNMLFFGESKVSIRLENGIALVNKSLQGYEKEIKDEFLLCLSESQIKICNLPDEIVNGIQTSISFEQFALKAHLKQIGVPIFICHGEDVEPKQILKEMGAKVNKRRILGFDTNYICISLPIINKETFFEYLTGAIKVKLQTLEAQLS